MFLFLILSKLREFCVAQNKTSNMVKNVQLQEEVVKEITE